MSGASPGRGHPGRGGSLSKAQASRPTLGQSSQASSNGTTNPRVAMKQWKATGQGSTVSKKEESKVAVGKGLEGSAAPCAAKKLSVSKDLQQSPRCSNSTQGSPVSKQQPSAASGVQSSLLAVRQRRTSLERQTLQENLQQQDLVTGMARAGRTRSQSGGSDKSAAEPETTKPAMVPATETFKHPETPLRVRPQKETPHVPEPQLAEETPGLAQKLRSLEVQKEILQVSIDCVYKVKAANPGDHTMLDQRLNSLGAELAIVVRDMDCVLGRMGPRAETYRDQERAMPYKQDSCVSGSDTVLGGPRQQGRPLLQPASFCFQKGQTLHHQPQEPVADPEQRHKQILAEVPQVPGCPVQQQDNGLAVTSSVHQGSDDGDNNTVPVGLGAGGSAESVWDAALSDDIEIDVNVNNVCDFPPLIPNTQGVTGPPAADPPPVSQPSVTQQVPRSNAWSRGAPSLISGDNYTGQAFKRRNVVRFKHRGAKEELPDRRFVVRELLCRQMGFVPINILAVINLPDRQGYDVSFKLMPDLDRFWANFPKFRDTEGWNKFIFVPISRPDTVTVNIIFWNEAVPPQDIVVWLRRHCDLVSDLTKNRDDDDIWTGGWKVLVKLRQCNNITAHLPNSFFIGREKGVCFYPGQPRKCFKCGKGGHLANVCNVVKCSLCGVVGHVAADCQNIRCNLCGKIGHPHRDCPDAWHNICRDLPDEELVVEAEGQEEEALLSGEILTRAEIHQGSGHQGSEVHQGSDHVTSEQQCSEGAEGSMEVVPQDQQSQVDPMSVSTSASEGSFSYQGKRKKKDKTSRISEEQYETGQSAKKMVQSSAGAMVVSNRYEVLSEGESEKELERIDAECNRDIDDHPPPKRKPLPADTQVESDMETGQYKAVTGD